MCMPKYAVGDKVAWTNGVVCTIVDGPFMGNVYRYGDHAQPYTPFSYVVDFEGDAALEGFARLLPENALRPEWTPCDGEYRQVEGGGWEKRKEGDA